MWRAPQRPCQPWPGARQHGTGRTADRLRLSRRTRTARCTSCQPHLCLHRRLRTAAAFRGRRCAGFPTLCREADQRTPGGAPGAVGERQAQSESLRVAKHATSTSCSEACPFGARFGAQAGPLVGWRDSYGGLSEAPTLTPPLADHRSMHVTPHVSTAYKSSDWC